MRILKEVPSFEDFERSAHGGSSGLEKALVVVILRLPFPPRRLLLQLFLFLLFNIFLSVLTFLSFSFVYPSLWSLLLILFLVVSILFFCVSFSSVFAICPETIAELIFSISETRKVQHGVRSLFPLMHKSPETMAQRSFQMPCKNYAGAQT